MIGSAGAAASGKLRREARMVGLLFASTTSMIGSGWLFGAYHASRIAGPLSIWSWVVGAGHHHADRALLRRTRGAMFPRSGALVHMSHARRRRARAHLGVDAFSRLCADPGGRSRSRRHLRQQLSALFPAAEFRAAETTGFIVCALLLGVFAWLNLLAVRALLRFNNAVTWWKLAVPVLTVIVLIAASTHWDVWSADKGSYKVSGIFTALPDAGIVFSYLGFRAAIDLGGESRQPRPSHPTCRHQGRC